MTYPTAADAKKAALDAVDVACEAYGAGRDMLYETAWRDTERAIERAQWAAVLVALRAALPKVSTPSAWLEAWADACRDAEQHLTAPFGLLSDLNKTFDAFVEVLEAAREDFDAAPEGDVNWPEDYPEELSQLDCLVKVQEFLMGTLLEREAPDLLEN